jgi:ABC-2 type transport system ATP-binding protein
LPVAPQDGVNISDLSHSYGGKPVLQDVNLRVPRGSSVALLGPNGAGKTTLMNIICALVRPDSGKVVLDGVDVLRRPGAVRRNIGVVFQDASLDDRLTAWENLEFHGLVYGMPARQRRARIDEVLELVELTDWRETIVRSFSGGMKRRLEIARALMHEPGVLFLDEPTAGLDAQTRARIWAYLDTLRKKRSMTVLTTTHYIEEVEGCDHIYIIDHGRVIAEGSPDVLKHRYGKTFIRCVPRTPEVASAIRAAYPGVQTLDDERLVVPAESPDALDRFLGEFGSSLREIQIDEPGLETVFLSLTGRELRDRMDGQRAAELAAGRRAGRR